MLLHCDRMVVNHVYLDGKLYLIIIIITMYFRLRDGLAYL